ncbi:MAG: oligopeptide ABC transporter ATP-binding protein, partial [Chloroflexi bacterium]|nr:oligopeptide ABC transporter ATP-binding protein [Chloroflexota bacterium]
MYVGQLVELGSTPQIFSNPLHPYTAALMSAIPEADPTKPMKLSALKGEVPNPVNPPTGCRFHTRCQFTQDIC